MNNMNATSSAGDPFKACLDNFKTRLTKEELHNFQYTSLNDLKVALLKIQDDQARRKSMMNLPRVKAFVEAFVQFGAVIEVFLNSSSILCFVWGPMKFCLQTASSWADSFDTLLDAYQQLAENIPLVNQYADMFKGNTHMNTVLGMIFEDILEFHRAALRVFSKPTWKQLFRATWKDFNSKFQHILTSLSRHKALIESQASILQFKEYQMNSVSFKNSFMAIENEESKNRRLTVLNWLAATDSMIDQEIMMAMRQEYPFSGNWIFQDSKMKAWLDSQQSTLIPVLWINGIPGAGKTILTSVIIEKCLQDSTTSTVFFFCKFQDDQRSTFVAVARAIIAQLLKENDDLLSYLYDQCINSNSVSLTTERMCTEILKVCVGTISKKTRFIIDGLDECEPVQRQILISKLISIIEKSTNINPGLINALFVSQNETDIKKLLSKGSHLQLSSSCNKSDIEHYSKIWSEKIQKKFDIADNTKSYIVSAVSEASEGMFLYAKLVLTNLYNQTSLEQLREELEPGTFPSGFEQAYSRIVARMYNNPNDKEREAALNLMGWITCAKRPMRLPEIQAAVAVDINGEVFCYDDRRLRIDITDLCGSLVEFHGNQVQLVHSTAKSYLVKKEHVKLNLEERKLVILCLRYLLFGCFDPAIPNSEIQTHVENGFYAFLEYAIIHWLDHLDSMIEFLAPLDLEPSSDIGSAINGFFELYGVDDTKREDVLPELEKRFAHLGSSDQSNNLLLLLSHNRKARLNEQEVTTPSELKAMLGKVRACLEELNESKSLTIARRGLLESYYGQKWIKCPRHTCFYFHEGFSDKASRKKHVERHEKPFLCTEPNCLRVHIGFSTEKDRKRHMFLSHPDPSILGKFPKVNREAEKYKCEVCLKEFTRSHSLRIHRKTHTQEKPFSCEICGKDFLRKHDRDRHKTTHTKEGLPGNDTGRSVDVVDISAQP